jgi:hypothetical protein
MTYTKKQRNEIYRKALAIHRKRWDWEESFIACRLADVMNGWSWITTKTFPEYRYFMMEKGDPEFTETALLFCIAMTED